MKAEEQQWDRLLKIRTSGRDDSRSDQFRYPYEPTDYCVLNRLSNSGYLGRKNVLLDYGCGKGRVEFFLAYQNRCRCIGIEYDERIYQAAIENQKNAVSGNKTSFFHVDALDYQVPKDVDRIFFFNPFSRELLSKVLFRVLESFYENPRELFLFFYYPSDEYVAYLMQQEELLFTDEISCSDLFEGENERERILIFEVL